MSDLDYTAEELKKKYTINEIISFAAEALNAETAELFLAKLLNMYISEYEIADYKKLLDSIIGYGVDLKAAIQNANSVDIKILNILAEDFLNDETAELFLAKLLNMYISEDKIADYKKLLDSIIGYGVDLKAAIQNTSYVSIKKLNILAEIFLSAETAELFLDKLLNVSSISDNDIANYKELLSSISHYDIDLKVVIQNTSYISIKNLNILAEIFLSAETAELFLVKLLNMYISNAEITACKQLLFLISHYNIDLKAAIQNANSIDIKNLNILAEIFLSAETAELFLAELLNMYISDNDMANYKQLSSSISHYNVDLKSAIQNAGYINIKILNILAEDFLNAETAELFLDKLLNIPISNASYINIKTLNILAEYVLNDKTADLFLSKLMNIYVNEEEFLISIIKAGADLDKVIYNSFDKDHWVQNPSIAMTDYLIKKNHLNHNHMKNIFTSHFLRGNYEYANKIYKLGVQIKGGVVDDFVDAVFLGLKNSVENNKYQGVLALFAKAGIAIPERFFELVASFQDDIKPTEFVFLNGLLHKLALHYTELSKKDFIQNLKMCNNNENIARLVEHAFAEENNSRYADFYHMQKICSHSPQLNKIESEFDAYYQVLGRALDIFDNDYTLEILTINGLPPSPLQTDLTVFRGMKVYLSDEDISSYFKYGTRGFSVGNYQKFMGYYVNELWNKLEGARWEFGGTYTSLDPHMAATFAQGQTGGKGDTRILFEIKPLQNSPKVCGIFKFSYEFIFSTIYAEQIVAVYKLRADNYYSESFFVQEVWQNPYLAENISPNYRIGDEIKKGEKAVEAIYNQLNCEDFPVKGNAVNGVVSGKYENYEDFLSKYSQNDYVGNSSLLYDNYFSHREPYAEISFITNSEKCDISQVCCN